MPGRWEDRVSLPLSGSLEYKRHLGRTGGYRFMITDAYHYDESIHSTIEHGPTGNKIPTDYTAVTFLYSDGVPDGAGEVPAVERREVSVPDKAVFHAGVTTPIHSFSRSNATLTKKGERIKGENVRYVSLRANIERLGNGQFICFILDVPTDGEYRVLLEAVKGPEQAVVQIHENDQPHGERVDLYAPEREKSDPVAMGIVDMKKGDNRLFIKLVGKNPASEGFGCDIVRIICERVE